MIPEKAGYYWAKPVHGGCEEIVYLYPQGHRWVVALMGNPQEDPAELYTDYEGPLKRAGKN